jgi:hypothetical protein
MVSADVAMKVVMAMDDDENCEQQWLGASIARLASQ